MSQLFVESQSLDLCSNIHYTMYATFLCITVLCEITGVETFISSSPHIWSSLFLNHGASSKIRFSSFFFSFHKLFIFVMRRNVYGAYASSYMLFFSHIFLCALLGYATQPYTISNHPQSSLSHHSECASSSVFSLWVYREDRNIPKISWFASP